MHHGCGLSWAVMELARSLSRCQCCSSLQDSLVSFVYPEDLLLVPAAVWPKGVVRAL